jgi:hypothetical protein
MKGDHKCSVSTISPVARFFVGIAYKWVLNSNHAECVPCSMFSLNSKQINLYVNQISLHSAWPYFFHALRSNIFLLFLCFPPQVMAPRLLQAVFASFGHLYLYKLSKLIFNNHVAQWAVSLSSFLYIRFSFS